MLRTPNPLHKLVSIETTVTVKCKNHLVKCNSLNGSHLLGLGGLHSTVHLVYGIPGE